MNENEQQQPQPKPGMLCEDAEAIEVRDADGTERIEKQQSRHQRVMRAHELHEKTGGTKPIHD